MPDTLLLAAAVAANIAAMGWLALSMDVHWEQARGTDPLPRRTVVQLRWLGGLGLFTSLLLCLAVDHASMASLVWFMTLAGAALGIAFTLSWRPRVLRPLVAWVGAGRAPAA
ncbi:DUF3325 domain-containing protein [Paracidovorax wautersii]|uniref:DUF3325 domain-containing protein n=1 Tax=Paracidovorax wautersii TaxID=1177982 RepID=A0ABU1IEP4_9BURK|nr:DUF3325 domain-containing protein [Paracidovorax wautersii]MDR6215685.1 hypothetical protein [Paracidovorax wautersii]